jgi:hypothetical protein
MERRIIAAFIVCPLALASQTTANDFTLDRNVGIKSHINSRLSTNIKHHVRERCSHSRRA